MQTKTVILSAMAILGLIGALLGVYHVADQPKELFLNLGVALGTMGLAAAALNWINADAPEPKFKPSAGVPGEYKNTEKSKRAWADRAHDDNVIILRWLSVAKTQGDVEDIEKMIDRFCAHYKDFLPLDTRHAYEINLRDAWSRRALEIELNFVGHNS